MIDSIRASYAALRTRPHPDADDLVVVELSSARGAYAGLDHIGREHLLIPIEPGTQVDMSDVAVATLAFGSRTLDVGAGASSYLDITCLFDSVAEVFEHFVAAIFESLEKESGAPANAVTRVLNRWRLFLEPPEAPPGRNKLASVLGELLVLVDLARVEPSASLEAWVGPFGSRHDFRRADLAIEVKTTRSHTSRRITIHGEDQLETPEEGELFLHLVRLEEVAGSGQSVADAVDQLLSLGVNPEALFTALSASGVALTELAATADVRFDVRERLTIPVDDEMPRIVPASFVGGARPVGVVDVSYVIDLDHRLDAALGEPAYAGLVSQISGATQ